MQQPDLFAVLTPPCHECQNWGKPIDSGVAYCWGSCSWRWPTDQVLDCPYRDRTYRHGYGAALNPKEPTQ